MPAGYNLPFKTVIFGPINLATKNVISGRKVHFRGKIRQGKELEEFIEKLTKDVKKHGIKRPLEVAWHLTPDRIDKLTVNFGGSRYYVAKKLKLKTIPCYLCVYVYKVGGYNSRLRDKDVMIMESLVECLKKILPFISETDGERYGVVPSE